MKQRNTTTPFISFLGLSLFLTLTALSSFVRAVGTTGALNDTGQTLCYDGSSMVTCTLANTGDNALYPRQDGRYGRDAAALAGQLTKIGGGTAGFNFTKIANNGSALPASAILGTNSKNWGCTRDNVTGLFWQAETNGTYSWSAAQGLVTTINSIGLCGFNDWRLPSPRELHGITHADSSSAIDTDYLPITWSAYWTGNEYVPSSGSYAWSVNFADYHGSVLTAVKDWTLSVRLVRGAQLLEHLIDNKDGTVTQDTTGLTWAKCSEGQTYNSGACSGNASAISWVDALAAAKNSRLAGHDDWRLPNAEELASLVDYSRFNPAINTSIFSIAPFGWYWTSTSYMSDPSAAWFVGFDDGNFYSGGHYHGAVIADSKSKDFNVRLVRGGQSFDSLTNSTSSVVKGTVTWAKTPYSIKCTNNTTTESILLPRNKTSSYDCEKSGLVINSGDNVTLTVNGNKK
ncbi:exported hypothetical protein [Gammaproteobacteria bacterium]